MVSDCVLLVLGSLARGALVSVDDGLVTFSLDFCSNGLTADSLAAFEVVASSLLAVFLATGVLVTEGLDTDSLVTGNLVTGSLVTGCFVLVICSGVASLETGLLVDSAALVAATDFFIAGFSLFGVLGTASLETGVLLVDSGVLVAATDFFIDGLSLIGVLGTASFETGVLVSLAATG